jgi:hypothetical protein
VRRRQVALLSGLALALIAALSLQPGCQGGVADNTGDGGTTPPPVKCDGPNCTTLPPNCTTPNACGTCDPGCNTNGGGNTPFPLDPTKDPNVKDANGVKLDPNGDIVLDDSAINFNYMWIANTYDTAGSTVCGKANANTASCRGTVSKVDTVAMKEVARYYTVTCATKGGSTGCTDVNGKPIVLNHNHTPSRTAVDFNFDVWVANRSVHGGQPSATKIANDPGDCIDRNKNGKIDTSKDQNGDGKITVDCNGDGVADNASTVCTGALAGKTPEFLGDDDECILHTTNYAEDGDKGRSICLDAGKANIGASTAWVGTFSRPENGRGNNRFYGINGDTGKIEAEVELPAGHHTYGCMADSSHIIWATDIGSPGLGSLTFFSTLGSHPVGPLMRGPSAANPWKNSSGGYRHYGISINGDQHVWLGGYDSYWVLRYKPNRASFDTLSKGTWTRIDMPSGFVTRGIAADARGKVWVAIQDGGYIARLDQSITDGVHDMTGMKDYWPTAADTVIGVGVDFNGNLWAGGHSNHMVSRLDVDAKGNVILPATGKTKSVALGKNPYTYSDFTGYGLMTWVRPQGRYVYQLKACPEGVKATWTGVKWNATTPTGTSVQVRVRSGDSDATMGSWSTAFDTSPAAFGPKASTPLTPNPAIYLQVEFTLKNTNKQGTPVLHDYAVSYVCGNVIN